MGAMGAMGDMSDMGAMGGMVAMGDMLLDSHPQVVVGPGSAKTTQNWRNRNNTIISPDIAALPQ